MQPHLPSCISLSNFFLLQKNTLFLYTACTMRLTWDEFYAICQEQKPTQFKPPDWDKVEAAVANKLAIEPCDLLHKKIVELKSSYNKFTALRHKKSSNLRNDPCTDFVLRSSDFTSPRVPPETPEKKPRTSIEGKVWTR